MPPSNPSVYQIDRGRSHYIQPNIAFVAIIFVALIAFEIFNYSTTDHALSDLLGDLTFIGIPWSTILAVAFCGIDFAGIARLFTPEQGADEPHEVWYLFGAWLLAATMNAILTWWGVSMAVVNRFNQGSSVLDPATMMQVVPIFVAIMVWVIRILIIGTLSMALDRLFHTGGVQAARRQDQWSAQPAAQHMPSQVSLVPSGLNSSAVPARPSGMRASAARAASAAPRSVRQEPVYEDGDPYQESAHRSRIEPSYHSLSAKGQNSRGSAAGTGNRYLRS